MRLKTKKMNIAYIRVSTIEQNTIRQYDDLEKAKIHIDRFFEEKISGKNITDREQLKIMLDVVRDGDTVYVESLSRLARNLRDLLDIIEQLTAKKVNLVSLKEKLDLSTPAGRLYINITASVYQFERECILERTLEGVAIAKAAGKYKGKIPKKRPKNYTELLFEYEHRSINKREFAQLAHCSRNTLNKWLTQDQQIEDGKINQSEENIRKKTIRTLLNT